MKNLILQNQTNQKFTSQKLVPWLAMGSLLMLAFVVVSPFLVPLAWAGILSYASWPLAQRIRHLCKGRDTLAAIISTILAALTLFLPLLWLAWLAQQELTRLYPVLLQYLSASTPLPEALKDVPWLGAWLTELLKDNPQGLTGIAKSLLADNANALANIASGISKNVAKFVLALLILFFFYRDGARILLELRHVLAKFIGPNIHGYLHAAGSTARAVVYGVLLTALVQGFVAGLGYWVAGLSSPVMFGVLTAILALIPFCTPIAWGSAGLWLLMQGQTTAAIGVWIWGAVVVSQLDNILRPIFISNVSAIPFLLVLFGVLGGLLAFGLIGLFIGPIILAVLWAVWREWTTHLQDEPLALAIENNIGK
jgi:predicted PurR-regulated permease PerM